jgi:hypothetical protein
VTFSDRKVCALINSGFVAAWINRGPGFHNENYSAENWIYRSAGEAYPTKNICTFILAPDGTVFHSIAGYFAPETFRRELQAALKMRCAAFDEKMRLLPDGFDALSRLHGEEAGRIERERAALPAVPDYRGSRHEHTEACDKAHDAGRNYLIELHRHWSKRDALPAFEDIRFDYVYGDPFTEEPRKGGASAIRGQCVGR